MMQPTSHPNPPATLTHQPLAPCHVSLILMLTSPVPPCDHCLAGGGAIERREAQARGGSLTPKCWTDCWADCCGDERAHAACSAGGDRDGHNGPPPRACGPAGCVTPHAQQVVAEMVRPGARGPPGACGLAKVRRDQALWGSGACGLAKVRRDQALGIRRLRTCQSA